MYIKGIIGERYLDDLSRTTRDNKLSMVRALDVEAQVAQYLMSFHLPPNWREEALTRLCSPEHMAAMERSEQEIESRLARLVDLYLAGNLEREQYEREKTVCSDRLQETRPALCPIRWGTATACHSTGHYLQARKQGAEIGQPLTRRRPRRCVKRYVIVEQGTFLFSVVMEPIPKIELAPDIEAQGYTYGWFGG